MKKALLLNSLITLSLYSVFYLLRSFIIWKFTNPIWWVLQIPTYSEGERTGIIFGWLMWQGVQLGICYSVISETKEKEEDHRMDVQQKPSMITPYIKK